MKKIWKIGIIGLTILLAGMLFVAKIEEISAVIIKYKGIIMGRETSEERLITTDVDFSKYEPLIDERGEWYTKYPLVSHACGGVSSMVYTNSKEALSLAIENGHKLIEIDFAFTSDYQYVCSHIEGTYKKTYEEFMQQKIYGIFTPIDLEYVVEIMNEQRDIYIITDCKCSDENRKRLIEAIADMARKKGMEDVLDRFIIQIYYEDDYNMVQSIYPFKVLYTLYEANQHDFNRVAEFCIINDIHVVTIPADWIQGGEDISVFSDMNIKVYTHTINTLNDMITLKELGVEGFYTDYVRPEDYRMIK